MASGNPFSGGAAYPCWPADSSFAGFQDAPGGGLMSENILPPPPPPAFPQALAIYHLDGDTQDASGNGYHLTLPAGVGFQAGKFTQGAYCTTPGGNINMTVAGTPVIPSGEPRAVCFWCWKTLIDNNGSEVNCSWSVTNPLLSIIYADRNVVFASKPDGSALLESVETFAEGQWHHIVNTTDGHTIRVYGDGALLFTFAYTAANCSPNFQVGVLQGGDVTSRAVIDEVLVFAADLTDAQILALYNATGPFVQPVMLERADEGEVSDEHPGSEPDADGEPGGVADEDVGSDVDRFGGFDAGGVRGGEEPAEREIEIEDEVGEELGPERSGPTEV